MTPQEVRELLAGLRARHHAAFVRWYDSADYSTIAFYAEIGFLLDRHFMETDVEPPEAP